MNSSCRRRPPERGCALTSPLRTRVHSRHRELAHPSQTRQPQLTCIQPLLSPLGSALMSAAQMADRQDPDLAKEKRQQMNAVLFETKDAGKQEWAKKRDAEATKA